MRKLGDNILSWCNNPEEEAIKQAQNIAKHPCLVGNVCLMPDTHVGYGMPIGGVVALKDAICPNMVGVDIGCGMLAIHTTLNHITKEQLLSIIGGSKEYKGGIKARIPVGFNHHKKEQENIVFNEKIWQQCPICWQEFQSAKHQIGTLGGGNHFIEIQQDHNGDIWFMIHSGSRNLGYKVANHYNKIAEKLCKQFKQDEVVKNELAFLPKGTDEFNDYWEEMNLCLEFAYCNRKAMADVLRQEFARVIPDVHFIEEINIHHNYASIEHHYNQNVYVHRKGATLAHQDTVGIIPGSQGTNSYIVQGLGNPVSLCSCSHGAGRKMSRKKAVENLNLENEQRILNDKGIIHSLNYKNALDEAPGAYKNIADVMDEQKDLVKIIYELTPLAVIKG